MALLSCTQPASLPAGSLRGKRRDNHAASAIENCTLTCLSHKTHTKLGARCDERCPNLILHEQGIARAVTGVPPPVTAQGIAKLLRKLKAAGTGSDPRLSSFPRPQARDIDRREDEQKEFLSEQKVCRPRSSVNGGLVPSSLMEHSTRAVPARPASSCGSDDEAFEGTSHIDAPNARLCVERGAQADRVQVAIVVPPP